MKLSTATTARIWIKMHCMLFSAEGRDSSDDANLLTNDRCLQPFEERHQSETDEMDALRT